MLLYWIFLTENNIIFPLMKDPGDPVSLKLKKNEDRCKKKKSLDYRLASNSAWFEDSVFFFCSDFIFLAHLMYCPFARIEN